MPDYQATSRSNYVYVKDLEKAKRPLVQCGNIVQSHAINPNLIFIEGTQIGFSNVNPFDEDPKQAFEWEEWAKEHLVPGQTLILQQIGNERLRYLTAGVSIYSWDGRRVFLDMRTLMINALKTIGLDEDKVALPEYGEFRSWGPEDV